MTTMSISLHIEAASAQELWVALAKLLDTARGEAASADRPAITAETPAPAGAPAAPQYDIATLANASRSLVTAGRQGELTQLLREFGVARLADVPPQRFGEYALGLRALGVQI